MRLFAILQRFWSFWIDTDECYRKHNTYYNNYKKFDELEMLLKGKIEYKELQSSLKRAYRMDYDEIDEILYNILEFALEKEDFDIAIRAGILRFRDYVTDQERKEEKVMYRVIRHALRAGDLNFAKNPLKSEINWRYYGNYALVLIAEATGELSDIEKAIIAIEVSSRDNEERGELFGELAIIAVDSGFSELSWNLISEHAMFYNIRSREIAIFHFLERVFIDDQIELALNCIQEMKTKSKEMEHRAPKDYELRKKYNSLVRCITSDIAQKILKRV